MIRAVVDTNIVVSGLLFGGLPYKIVKQALDKKFIPVTSPHLIAEIERVMLYPKFTLSPQEVRLLLDPYLNVTEIVIPTETISVIKSCPADNRVLE